MSRLQTVILAGFAVAAVAFAQAAPKVEWKDMLQFFSPPEQYKDKLGDYRSVMKFDDGSEVREVAPQARGYLIHEGPRGRQIGNPAVLLVELIQRLQDAKLRDERLAARSWQAHHDGSMT